MTPKHEQQKKKIDELDFTVIKTLAAKIPSRKWKDNQQHRENIYKSYLW